MFSSFCVIINSLCSTFNKYLLSVLRLLIDSILRVGSGFATLPFSLIKSTSSGRMLRSMPGHLVALKNRSVREREKGLPLNTNFARKQSFWLQIQSEIE